MSSNGARTAWTADELVDWYFPAPRWAVPDLLAEGANLLVGPPKVGKSWLSLNIAVAVASGGRALDRIEVDEGDVLYLALEDTGRRLKSRLRKILSGGPAPSRLTLTIACERLSAGGIELRQQRLALARLVVALRVPLGDQEDQTPANTSATVARLQRRGLRGVYGGAS